MNSAEGFGVDPVLIDSVRGTSRSRQSSQPVNAITFCSATGRSRVAA